MNGAKKKKRITFFITKEHEKEEKSVWMPNHYLPVHMAHGLLFGSIFHANE
jgi:hypothetical protein